MTDRPTRYGVRPAVVDDADRLGVVHTQVWREAYASAMPADFLGALDPVASARRWRETLLAPHPAASTLVATADDLVVGFATTGPSRDDPPVPDVELYAINLLAELHGTGVAHQLLEAALRPVGDQPVSLWVLATNDRARAFYTRYGFVPDGRTKTHRGTGVDEVRLVRPAQAPAT